MKKPFILTIISLIFCFVLQAQNQKGETETCVNCAKNEINSTSSALGVLNVSSGETSFASGTQNTSSGDYSTTLGLSNQALSSYSFAGGQLSKASGLRAFAFGQNAEALGSRSFAIGKYVVADGSNAVIIGRYAKALSSDAMVIGCGSNIDNYLQNSTSSSLMIGFNSNIPTLFIGPSDGPETTGNIGIGTYDPTHKLEVNGTFKVNNWSYMRTINLEDDDIKFIDELSGNDGLKFKGKTLQTSTQMILTEEGDLGIGTLTPGYKLDVAGDIRFTGQLHDANGLFEPSQWEVNGSNISFNTGNVGIGVPSPASKLTVEGNAGTQNWLVDIHNTQNTNAIYGLRLRFDTESDPENNDKLFAIEGFSKSHFIVNGAGNVGIGVSNPLDKFIVKENDGSISFSTVSSNLPRLRLTSEKSATVHNWDIMGDLVTGGAPGVYYCDLKFKYQNQDKFGMDHDGNFFFSGNLYKNGELYNPNFWDKMANNNLVYEDGNIGIGTDDISAKLHIVAQDQTGLKVDVYHSDETDDNWGYGIKCITSNPNTSIITKAIVVEDGAEVENFLVLNDGRVYVNNTLTATEVKVKADIWGWGDNVFHDDYQLRELQDVETFINENGHLPDVPSETEVLDSGINLAEMDAILIKKIEELTLYVIEQDKMIQMLKTQLNEKE